MGISKFAGVCIIKDKKILLVQEAHKEACGLWSLPLGHMEDDENESDTAKRETKEETGYDVILGQSKKIFLNGVDLKSTSNFNDQQIELTIFDSIVNSGNLLKGDDVMSVKWFPLNEVDQLPLRGEWIKCFLKDFV